MKTAVFIVCLVGLAYAYPTSSDSNSSHMDSPESHDTSSSEEFTIPPAVNITLEPLTNQPRGDSLRLRRALRQFVSSSESHSKSISNSIPDSSDSSSSEELRTVPTVDGATAGQALTENLRRKRAAGQKPHSSSSEHSSESTTTESISSHTSESSEEDSHEHSTKQNLLQGILETSTVPDTSEESSEERTTNTPIFQP
ncbi:flocculation protein FLO11-like [Rana temporaria]|uniref:flocculation protein FLO11-like n=1 Tax=Rana temporaria TaxID=8407 RepID=UPI001AACE9E1|nr:flocculation protein FLO11-like [Rana temporaria]